MKRPRTKKGRFLTKKEIEALKKKVKEKSSDKASDPKTTSKEVDKAKEDKVEKEK